MSVLFTCSVSRKCSFQKNASSNWQRLENTELLESVGTISCPRGTPERGRIAKQSETTKVTERYMRTR
eukprot:5371063-Amphidinium_carterae.1